MQVDSSSAADILGFSKTVTSEEDSKQNLAQEDFITLMLTQFKNQDPFSSQDNGDFLAQMAQFSTVEGIGDMQRSMEAMVASMKASQVLEASVLVGKGALVESDTVAYSGVGITGSVDVPIHTASVKIDIISSSGARIDSFTVNNAGPGLVDFYWDGTDINGDAVAAGNYDISATFFNGTESEAVTTLIRGKINSVSLDGQGGSSQLEIVGLGLKSLDAVREISSAE